MQLSVRDVDEKVFKKFKARATEEDMPIGRALTMAMDTWLVRKEKRASLTDLKPMSFGKHTRNLSVDVDRTVYGD